MLDPLKILEVKTRDAHQYPLVPGHCSSALKLTSGASQINFVAKRTVTFVEHKSI